MEAAEVHTDDRPIAEKMRNAFVFLSERPDGFDVRLRAWTQRRESWQGADVPEAERKFTIAVYARELDPAQITEIMEFAKVEGLDFSIGSHVIELTP
jgi:hypothetical protein